MNSGSNIACKTAQVLSAASRYQRCSVPCQSGAKPTQRMRNGPQADPRPGPPGRCAVVRRLSSPAHSDQRSLTCRGSNVSWSTRLARTTYAQSINSAPTRIRFLILLPPIVRAGLSLVEHAANPILLHAPALRNQVCHGAVTSGHSATAPWPCSGSPGDPELPPGLPNLHTLAERARGPPGRDGPRDILIKGGCLGQ